MLKVLLAKMHCMRILLLADSDLITLEKIKYPSTQLLQLSRFLKIVHAKVLDNLGLK